MSDFPIIRRKSQSSAGSSSSSAGDLWQRITAFLAMRAPKTRETYLGIVREWCLFLGAPAGSPQAASLMLSASDMHAMAYRRWLEKRPGETPRLLKKGHTASGTSQQAALEIASRKSGNQKLDGLQSTLSNATIAKKFAALRRLYRMIIASGFDIKLNPFDTDRVAAPARNAGRKRPTEMIDFELVKTIIELPDENMPQGLRDKAILAVLFGGGLRRSEVSALRLGDVKKSPNGTVFLHLRATKAKRDFDQALPNWAAKIVSKLVELRLRDSSPGDYLFISYRGRGATIATKHPISGVGLYKLFKKYCKLAGAGDFVTPHSARATAITKLLADGIAHREVQEFSRHASIQMVEVYDKRRISVDQSPARNLDFDIDR